MPKDKVPKYVVEIHESTFLQESLATFYSDIPFLAFHIGDYIAPATCGEDTLKKGCCYQIIAMQHIITKEHDGSHKLCICVKSVTFPKNQ